jgi:hypothetical protein
MRYFLGVLFFTTVLFSAEPQTVGQAEMQFNREYNEAKAIFDKTVKVAQDKFVAFLKEEMKKLTTSGDLDGAIAIRDKIKSLESDIQKVIVPNKKVGNRIVVWNGHNGNNANSGTKQFDLILSLDNTTVFKKADIEIPWSSKEDQSVTIDIPNNLKFDSIKVEITQWVEVCACLSEVQVFINNENIALGKKVRSSGVNAHSDNKNSDQAINDGVCTSTRKRGFWVANDGGSWIEILLMKIKD